MAISHQVRRAHPDDAVAIADVARRTWHVTYNGIIPQHIQDQALDQWYSIDRIAQQTESPRSLFLVALAGIESLVGFVQISPRPEPGDAELGRFYVLPEYQKHGVGRNLLSMALETMQAGTPINRLFVQVEKDNEVGIKAYHRLGFSRLREYDEKLFGHATTMTEMCFSVSDFRVRQDRSFIATRGGISYG